MITVRFLEEVVSLISQEEEGIVDIFLFFKAMRGKKRVCVVLLSYFCLENLETLWVLLGENLVLKSIYLTPFLMSQSFSLLMNSNREFIGSHN